MQESVVSKGKVDESHSKQKTELTLRVGDDTITLQAHDSVKISSNKDDSINSVNKTNHGIQSSLQETLSKNTNKPRSGLYANNGTIHESRMLQIEELHEWRTYVKKEQKQHFVELKDRTNQFKVGDQVLLDKIDPRVVTSKPNTSGTTPFTVLNVFPYGTVKVTHSKFGTFKVNSTRLKPYFEVRTDSKREEFQLLKPTRPCE
ncbi:hypothetical protein GOBAR_AA18059 [Gossypium barbadense]|uniref:Uncharacterized protein n=1 Tax=Gossypium barbadense TaxID=3634 RepID=A0A2P5XH44_GOSBA|nr:hypothetical protein GOBAR_AA18059 [Gossypium barbadense]